MSIKLLLSSLCGRKGEEIEVDEEREDKREVEVEE